MSKSPHITSRLTLAAVFAAALSLPALAIPKVTQSNASGAGASNQTVTLAASPVNSDIIVAPVLSTATSSPQNPTSVTDSNGVSLTNEANATGTVSNVLATYVYDYQALNSPTGAFKCTFNVASSCRYEVVIEVSGANFSLAKYAEATGTSGTPSVQIQVASSPGGLAVCVMSTNSAGETVSLTNTFSTSAPLSATGKYVSYGTIGTVWTSGESVQCSGGATSTAWSVSLAIYPSTQCPFMLLPCTPIAWVRWPFLEVGG